MTRKASIAWAVTFSVLAAFCLGLFFYGMIAAHEIDPACLLYFVGAVLGAVKYKRIAAKMKEPNQPPEPTR